MKKLDILKNTFEIHFKNLMNLFNDTRIIYFSTNENERIFPNIELPLDIYHTVGVFWHKNIIEIKFNDEIIEKAYLKNSNKSLPYLKNTMKQIANHEYGHTLQFISMFYRLPQDTRDIILKKNPKDISKEDLIRCINNSKDRMIIEQKKCNNVHYAQIEHIFKLHLVQNLAIFQLFKLFDVVFRKMYYYCSHYISQKNLKLLTIFYQYIL